MTIVILFLAIPAELLKLRLYSPMVIIASEFELRLVYANFRAMIIHESGLLQNRIFELACFTTLFYIYRICILKRKQQCNIRSMCVMCSSLG